MDELLKTGIVAIVGTAGGSAALLGIGKWLFGKWLEAQKELRAMEKKQVDDAITELKASTKELDKIARSVSVEVKFVTDRLGHAERFINKVGAEFSSKTDQFISLSKTFQEYVKVSHERMNNLQNDSEAMQKQLKIVEAQSDQVIKIGRDMAARITGGKPPGTKNGLGGG
jgi:hypothetical protein